MLRKTRHKLWTFTLMLLLCGATTLPLSRDVRADIVQGTPGLPDPQGGGDPDWPTGGSTPSPKPGPTRGNHQSVTPRGTVSAGKGRLAAWIWNVRMAFVVASRVFFRF